jgi:hypothetical protein
VKNLKKPYWKCHITPGKTFRVALRIAGSLKKRGREVRANYKMKERNIYKSNIRILSAHRSASISSTPTSSMRH